MASPGKKHFVLRIDPHLWDAVEALAMQELRSANAQVEMMLREGLAKRGRKVVRAVEAADTPRPAAPSTKPEDAA